MRISDWSSDVCSSDLPALGQLVEHAPERLLGDRQQGEQMTHREIGLARDEIERAVVRPAEPLRGQPAIDRARHVAVAEIKQLDATADFGFAQEERRGGLSWGSPVDRFCRYPSKASARKSVV